MRHVLPKMVAVRSQLSNYRTSDVRVWIVGQSCCLPSATADDCNISYMAVVV